MNSPLQAATEPGTARKRDGTADLLKGLAVLFMIQVHIMEQFGNTELFQSLAGKISLFLGGPFCAPVFLVVMGYYLLPLKKSGWTYLKRGIILFLGGLVLNVLRSLHLLQHIEDQTIQVNPVAFIFGVDILPLAGLSLILLTPVMLLFRTEWKIYLILAILISVTTWFTLSNEEKSPVISYLMSFITGRTSWAYFPLIPWISYILAGMAARSVTIRYPGLKDIFTDVRILWLILPGLFILLITLPEASAITHDLDGPTGYYHHQLPFFAWTILFILVYFFVIRHLEQSWGNSHIFRLIHFTGEQVTLIYIIQWLIIGNMATALYKSQGWWGFLGWTLVISFLSVGLARIFIWIRSWFGKPGT
jgi:hypothetical protein